MAELTESAPETVTISATADEEGKEARSSAKWVVIVLALIALSAIALFSRRRE